MPGLKNGLVIGLDSVSKKDFPLFENDKASEMAVQDSLRGIQECTTLSRVFFSKGNIDLLQDMIRYNVWLKSNKQYVIDNQSPIELEIIMRSIYFQHARNLPYRIADQVKELNNIIVNQLTPNILSGVEQYYGYIYRTENLPVPIQHPQNVNSAGTKLLRSVTSTF